MKRLLITFRRAWVVTNFWLLAVSALALMLVVLNASWSPHGIRDVFVSISFNLIAAFVFYLVLDVVSKVRSAEAISPYVIQQLRTLKGDVEGLCRELANSLSEPLPAEWSVNRGDLSQLFSRARLSAPANMIFFNTRERASLLDYALDRLDRTNRFLENLVLVGPYLGADVMAQVAAIQNDSYLAQLRFFRAFNIRPDQTFEFLARDAMEHYEAIERLERTASANGLFVTP